MEKKCMKKDARCTGVIKGARGMGFVLLFVLLTAACLVWPALVQAGQFEQMAIDTRALSMANNVTARPPGALSIHYNPAGLSQVPEGTWWNQGMTYPHTERVNTFWGNPDFPGLLNTEKWDHRADPIFGERYKEGEGEGGAFPGWGDRRVEDLKASGSAKSGRMFIPIYNEPINFAISPRTAVTHRSEGSRWTFATGMYAPYATGADHSGKDDPTRWGGKAAYVSHLIYQAPTAAFQVTDNLSVGLGVGAGMTAAGSITDIRGPSDLSAIVREVGQATEGFAIPPWSYLYWEDPLYGGGIHPWSKVGELEANLRNDFTPSYNLGMLYEPLEWLGLGLVYQSEIKADMHGTFKLEYGEQFQRMVNYYGSGPWGVRRTSLMLDLPINPVPYQKGVVTTTMRFPQRVQGGIRVSPLSRLHLMFDLKWAEWSIREQDETVMDQDIQLLQVAKLSGHKYGNRKLVTDRHMKDTLDWGVAVEYNLSERVDLHAGYEFRESANPTKYYDLTSMPDLHHYAVGGAYHFDNGGRIDFSFSYWQGNKKVGPDESVNLTSTDYFDGRSAMFPGHYFEQDLDVYMFSVGFMAPFESYVEYQGGNRQAMAERIRLLNPFTRLLGNDDE